MLNIGLDDKIFTLGKRDFTFRNNRVFTSYLVLLDAIFVNMAEISEGIEMSFLCCFLIVLNRIFDLLATALVSLLKKLAWIYQSFL
jgi:hypothetical protein